MSAGSTAMTRVNTAVAAAVDQFDLMPTDGGPVIVALSGGKDSILLCLALREIGIDMVPVTVDMGYEQGWGERVRKLVAPLGLDPHVVDVRGGLPRSPAVSLRLTVLDRLDTGAVGRGQTPCTHCYSVKAQALDHAAREHGTRTVAFAHHMTDAQASLVKEGLMHLDRADHDRFDRTRFERLALDLRDQTRRGDGGPLLDGIEELAALGRIDTDEPPRQPLTGGPVEIIRPLALVDETEIEAGVRERALETLGSGCGHGATLDTQTPREIVHWRVLRGMTPTAAARLRSAVLAGLDGRGERTVHSRARRRELLGDGYKPVEDGLDKV